MLCFLGFASGVGGALKNPGGGGSGGGLGLPHPLVLWRKLGDVAKQRNWIYFCLSAVFDVLNVQLN